LSGASSPERRSAGAAASHLRQLVRYATVSVVSTTVSLSILGTLVATSLVTAGWANVIATAAGTVPSFELNRRWVWRRTGRRSLAAEVVPFCALSFLGLALSTLAVSFAAGRAASLGTAARTLVAQGANVATFAALWVVQYLILDRVLFAGRVPLRVTTRSDPAVGARAA
jgi:putative flippase GtrA